MTIIKRGKEWVIKFSHLVILGFVRLRRKYYVYLIEKGEGVRGGIVTLIP
ncbi:hypothetical protein [Stygiolobus azoricus]|nr:hypothetical protein [Stygiolobus azoricus]